MLEGFVPFPDEFKEKYRDMGYWVDKPLREEFAERFRIYSDKIAIIDGETELSYSELDYLSTNLALNLLDLGLKPLDRVVPQLPNIKEFPILYIALQKIGCIPIASLVTHRYTEISQFVNLSGATTCVVLDKDREFNFLEMVSRVAKESETLEHIIVSGDAPAGTHSLSELIETPANRPVSDLEKINIDPLDPAVFQLSGGTTGIPKLIPRTHNDYAYNSKQAGVVTEVEADSCLLLVLPISHNLPLACPGMQGFMFQGAKVVLSTSAAAKDVFGLVETHKITHIHVVPALLIGWINDPSIRDYDLSSLKMIQSGGQRLQPEVRLKTRELIPSVFVQENFGMSEGVIMFIRRGDPEDVLLETSGRPVSPDDEIKILDEDDNEVKPGDVGEFCVRGPYTLRGYYGVPEHNAQAFTTDGFYRSGDLMRMHPSGNYIVEGRIKDLINRGGEKISAEEVENIILQHPAVKNIACVPMPDERLGERMCAFVVTQKGRSLNFEELISFLQAKEIAKFKLPERLELIDDLPVSTFGKVSKKLLTELISEKIIQEAGG
ncbi:MAG TPA: (2,3-dihydroxybenzoyl)adenylate synthase [Rhodospirillales bacterium]|nr:(2,3-dihydroxybenzoyl)adenylate synthase [Rhodospirillales bacterium]